MDWFIENLFVCSVAFPRTTFLSEFSQQHSRDSLMSEGRTAVANFDPDPRTGPRPFLLQCRKNPHPWNQATPSPCRDHSPNLWPKTDWQSVAPRQRWLTSTSAATRRHEYESKISKSPFFHTSTNTSQGSSHNFRSEAKPRGTEMWQSQGIRHGWLNVRLVQNGNSGGNWNK